MSSTRRFWPALVADCAIWAAWSSAVAWWWARRGTEQLACDGWLTRIRPWERDGRLYVRLGVRTWRRLVPDLGGPMGVGPAERRSVHDPGAWEVMAAETRRSEKAHWAMLLALPVEWMLGPAALVAPMTAYALVAHVAPIALQRYNRARLGALSRRRRDHPPAVAGRAPGAGDYLRLLTAAGVRVATPLICSM